MFSVANSAFGPQAPPVEAPADSPGALGLGVMNRVAAWVSRRDLARVLRAAPALAQDLDFWVPATWLAAPPSVRTECLLKFGD